MRLDHYSLGDYSPNAPWWKQILWYYLGSWIVQSSLLPFSGLKVFILKLFGATVGHNIRIKPGVQIKFPWKLTLGNYVWIGEHTWIDNIVPVTIGSHSCISQAVYLCTGNHDWSDPNFRLRPGEIHIQEGCWIAARAVIGPGVVIGRGAILGMGSVTGKSLQPMTIYSGNPAQPVKKRLLT